MESQRNSSRFKGIFRLTEWRRNKGVLLGDGIGSRRMALLSGSRTRTSSFGAGD